ncbi:uncharacterized protein LOC125856027 [Solanum stenotomum]|uniref:uncharacterized protein LOC125856027 n=1 Tax=Solanum stenotomum TaxID=172797 RepID=UPI0020D17EC7|nr:uncharacterized protein LOC125856027 [Solanum stenotomum]
MPVTRRSKNTSKQIDVAAGEGSSQSLPRQANQIVGQGQRQEGPIAGTSGADRAASTWICDFLNLDPPSFTGSDPKEDPQDFIDQIQRTLDVMHVSGKEAVELATYRLRGMPILWYEAWKQSRVTDAPLASWKEFKKVFLDHYLPLEIREARADQFLNLHQGNISVREYSLKFNSLSRHGYSEDASFCTKLGGSKAKKKGIRVGKRAVQEGQIYGAVYPISRGAQMSALRGRGVRGAASSCGVQNRTYALGNRQNLEASPDVVTGTLSIFSHIVYALIDPRSTLSYVTPLIAAKFKRTLIASKEALLH